jgi:hypothetical protein
MTIPQKLRFVAVEGSMLSDPMGPGSFLGRRAAAMPPDGWPEGTKPEQRHPIRAEGGEVTRDQRVRWAVVLDALQKGIDLLPFDEDSAKLAGVKWANVSKTVEAQKAALTARDKEEMAARAKADEEKAARTKAATSNASATNPVDEASDVAAPGTGTNERRRGR